MMIILYDGQCLFCEGWVKFVIRYKSKEDLKFIPIQFSDLDSKNHLLGHDYPSIVVIDSVKDKIYFNTEASLAVMKTLSKGFGLLALILSKFPKFLGDYVYRFIGRNRHKIFGTKDICEVPSSMDRSFFIESIEQAHALYKKESVDFKKLNTLVTKKYSDGNFN